MAIESFVHEFATNLLPSGSASGDITFTWAGVSIPEATYYVQINTWNSPTTTGSSMPYDGPPLSFGTLYEYLIGTADTYGNSFHATEKFVYKPLIP